MNLIYCLKNNIHLTQENIGLIGVESTLDVIAKKICNYYGISFELMRRKSNYREYVEPRQVFSYIVHTRELATLGKIAEFLCPSNPFNHATISHGRNNIANLIKNNKGIQRIVREIEESL